MLIKIDKRTIINVDHIIDVRSLTEVTHYMGQFSSEKEGGTGIRYIKDGVECTGEYKAYFDDIVKAMSENNILKVVE